MYDTESSASDLLKIGAYLAGIDLSKADNLCLLKPQVAGGMITNEFFIKYVSSHGRPGKVNEYIRRIYASIELIPDIYVMVDSEVPLSTGLEVIEISKR